ncbi:MAG: hypothetical protein F4X93_08185 [Proteobacteria bacterium]|nr:hypothetical protein [Pseudomonadota bacterium]
MKDGKGEEKGQAIEQQTASLTDVFDAMGRGVTVVSGNKRLAAVTLRAFEQVALERGLEAWPTPRIWHWPVWLNNVWEEAVISGSVPTPAFLLTPQQERRIWEDIVTESLAGQPLQQVPGVVRGVQEAWQLIQSWHISLTRDGFRYNRDSFAFFQWASQFSTRCRERGWLSSACLAERLQEYWQVGALAAPDELFLIGFDELAPRQHLLLCALVEAGCTVRWIRLADKDARAVRTVFPDARREAAGMARWVHDRLEKNPMARIGVIVPEFVTHREFVAQALDDMLVPQAIRPGHQSVERPYNLSLGLPLSAYPIVRTALMLLGLLNKAVSLEAASHLLRSPFIFGWQEETGPRALLDVQIREAGELEVSLGTLRYRASQADRPWYCPLFAENLGRWVQAMSDFRDTARPGQWSERFAEGLEAIGWAKGRPLSSEEYQSAQAWRELLVSFATLEPVTGAMRLSAALAQLSAMARERLFQPQTEVATVQVLELYQASWFQFDHLWIMGLHDGVWPPALHPNPFIPLPMQRADRLPRASEAHELQAARTVTQRLLACANEVVVSCAQQSGDEILRSSPLVVHLPASDSKALVKPDRLLWRDMVHEGAELTMLENDPAPALGDEQARGGSTVFKLQAACPFRAFAELRLGARPIRQAEIGPDAMVRGSLMHRVLEKVWSVLDSSERLAATNVKQLQILVGEQVADALAEMSRRYPRTFTKRFCKMEAERLRAQALEWLEREKHREPFQVIEREASHEVTVGGLGVRLRIDRIDELKDGRRVVIDYKTGHVSASQWFGDRPDEPQLPLYSLAVSGNVAGLLFAQVRSGAMAFKGVVEDEDMIGGVRAWNRLQQTRDSESWFEVLYSWRIAMEALGEAFCEGEAAVDPKQYPHTCRYCELGPLCRVDESMAKQAESGVG